MKIKLITACSMAAILLASCAKNKDLNLGDESISFNGKIQKAANVNTTRTWANGDQIGIFMVDHGTTTISGGHANRQYETTDGSTFAAVAGNELYYPVSDSKVDFISYYPYAAGVSTLGNYPVDVSAQTNLAVLDLLWAKVDNAGVGYNKTAGSNVPLVFDHKLAKLVIKPNASSGLDGTSTDWKNMGINIVGMNTKADFALSTGVLSNLNSIATITPFLKTAGAEYEAIILPATFTQAGNLKITFLIAGDTYTWNCQAGETFEAGKVYNFTIDVAKTGVTLGNVTINDWIEVLRTGTAN